MFFPLLPLSLADVLPRLDVTVDLPSHQSDTVPPVGYFLYIISYNPSFGLLAARNPPVGLAPEFFNKLYLKRKGRNDSNC